ncbi:uncharacterized protein LOC122855217 [Aphidius gifuensis]|uniref:uncharacterized protein LOC122855217 n=1 Tax=Aphidius gifuensis TaxID=684658 RepID=UPI001CDC5ADD|nr:uncharacterized protein LOC122855217 [Aphidius gifuensis]
MYCHNTPSWNGFSYLTKLKVLKVIFQTDDDITRRKLCMALTNSLINVAGTLTELSLSNWIEGSNHCDEITRDLTTVIPELKALKTIEIFGMAIDPDLSMYLKNSKILAINFDSLLTEYYSFKPDIFEGKNRKTLTELDLTSCQVSNDFLYNIANCVENVKILKVSCERVTDIGIVAISKIKFLQHLYLFGHSHVTDSSIKLLKKLKILHLPNSNKITNDSVTKILENSPKMKEFHIVESAITADFIKKASEITRNRKKKLKLEVSFIPGIKQYQSPYLDIIQNPPKKN